MCCFCCSWVVFGGPCSEEFAEMNGRVALNYHSQDETNKGSLTWDQTLLQVFALHDAACISEILNLHLNGAL